MKKIIALIMAAILSLSLFACGGGDSETETTAAQVSTTAEAITEATTEAVTEKVTETVTEAPVVTEAAPAAMADVTGRWKHVQYGDHHTITVNGQQGNTLYFNICSVRGNAAQIADCSLAVEMTVTGDTGYGTFTYEDSFLNQGTGEITVTADRITLNINPPESVNGGWGIMAASGDYTRA